MSSLQEKSTILITGAAGRIGTFLSQHLALDYHLRYLDIQPIPNIDDVIVIDITDFEAVLKAMDSVDIVIHLAANPSINQPWQDVYTSGISGTYNVFEAARQAGVQKIIYASTSHVSAGWEKKQQELLTPEMPIRPDCLYGVGKAFGEILGRFFAEQYDICVICLRIGVFIPQPKSENLEDRSLSIWCSPQDLAQLVTSCLKCKNLGFQIFYAVSNNTRRFFDISNAEELLGYKPQDNIEELL